MMLSFFFFFSRWWWAVEGETCDLVLKMRCVSVISFLVGSPTPRPTLQLKFYFVHWSYLNSSLAFVTYIRVDIAGTPSSPCLHYVPLPGTARVIIVVAERVKLLISCSVLQILEHLQSDDQKSVRPVTMHRVLQSFLVWGAKLRV